MYRRDLWIDQGVHVEVWTEKDAIRGVIFAAVTVEYDVPLMISRGFSSETFLYETAEDINDEGKPAVIYQLGTTIQVAWPPGTTYSASCATSSTTTST